ncbi:MAG TPA: hypothetical protein VFR33_03180 [Candidatus Dormibacteraeota bacterium]|nr:hypothetical protein [Candidatus Dormibacteraeota bacterium]
MTVSTLLVQTAGFGLPVAAHPVSAAIPIMATASATGASRKIARRGLALAYRGEV